MDYRDWRELLALVPEHTNGYTSRRARGACADLLATVPRPHRRAADTVGGREASTDVALPDRRISGRM
jgi:hypothetical protein